jgi:capsular polysaccharide biosynthesis protein
MVATSLDLQWIVLVIRRWLWLIVVLALSAGVLAYVVLARVGPEYAATVTLLVSPADAAVGSDYNALLAGERLALTYSQLMKSKSVIEQTIDQLNLPVTPDDLAAKISVETLRDTQLVRLTVVDASPRRAAQIANTLAEVFRAEPRTFEAQRYTQSITQVQGEIDRLTAQIAQAQAALDDLTASRIDAEVERTRIENLLALEQENLRAATSEHRDLAAASARAAESIRLVQPSQEPAAGSGSVYTATATVLVGQPAATGLGPGTAQLDGQLARTYAQLWPDRALLETAVAKPGIPLRATELAERVTVEPVPGTELIKISVADSNAMRAMFLADTLAALYAQRIQEFVATLYQQPIADLESELAAIEAQLADHRSQSATRQRELNHSAAAVARDEAELGDDQAELKARKVELAQLRQAALEAHDALVVTEPAYIPTSPVRSPLLYTALAASIGALAAIGAAFSIEGFSEHANRSLEKAAQSGQQPFSRVIEER